MPTLREWLHRLSGTMRLRRRRDGDLEEELRLHEQLAIEDARRRGLDPRDAVRAVRLRGGGASQAMEALRDQRGLPWLEDLARDTRHALRSMRRTPAFTAIALLTLALGIGANAAVFTLMDAVLFKPLPVRDPDSLVLLGDGRGSGFAVGQVGRSFRLYSHDLYSHLRETNAIDDLLAVESSSSGSPIAVRRDGWETSRPARAKFVSGNYFQALGVTPLLGRAIIDADDARSATPVAVVSFGYWKDTLNADPSVIGDTIDINGEPVTLVGVTPSEFVGETIEPDSPTVWLPIAAWRALDPVTHLVDEPDRHWLNLIGRLRSDDTATEAEARLTGALQNWLRARAGSTLAVEDQAGIAKSRVELTPVPGGVPRLRYTHSETLRMLLGISATVLLLVCVNIAGLLLAREIARRVERSVRLSLGATRGRLVRQSLAESLTLALAGGTAALLVGAGGARLLVALAFAGAEDVPIPTAPDTRVIAFTFALSCGAGALFGVLPAIRTSTNISRSMKDVRFRLGKALVIGQVALSVVMLAAAGTLTDSLVRLSRQPFGFDTDRVLVVSVDPRLARYEYSRLPSLYQQIEARLNGLPGVASAGFSYYSPFHGCCWSFSLTIPGFIPGENENTQARLNRVSPRYFETIGTRLLRGRAFSEQDTPRSHPAAIVNEAFARQYFSEVDPIGRTFRIDSQPDVDLEIVGVVEDAKYDEPREILAPMVFLPLLQMRADQPTASGEYHSNFISTIQVRTAGEPAGVAPLIRRTLAEIDPALPVLRMETIADHVGQGLGRERLSATLAAIFSVLALGLACVGLYGVMAYLVERRTAEIGLRMALGAARGSVIASVMREVLAQAAIGIVIGVPMALYAIGLIEGQLYGVIDLGPGTLAAVVGLLTAPLSLAGYVPARRAARLDPAVVLRRD